MSENGGTTGQVISEGKLRILPVVLVAALLTLVATTGILEFAERASQSRKMQRELVQMEALGNRLSALKWQALQQEDLSLELVSGVDDVRREMNNIRRSLLSYDVDARPLERIEKAFVLYVSAIVQEFRLIAEGELMEARRLDAARLQPAYRQLTVALSEASQFYEAVADRTERWARAGIVAVVITAVIAIGLMLLGFERARSAGRMQLLQIEQETIRRREERFRSLVHNASDVILIAAPTGAIQYASGSAHGVIGYTPEQLIGKPIADLVYEADSSRIDGFLEGIRALPENASQTVETRFRKASGDWSDVELVGANRLADPAIAGLVLTLRDISWRKRAEQAMAVRTEELKRSNEDLQQFAYAASHDLQEPLRMIIGYTTLLARRYKGKLDAEADEFIAFAVDGAKRMQSLIQDLLSYSRAGTQRREPAPTDCKEVVARALAALQLAIEESGSVISVGELPTVVADDTQLAQVFQNLIGNAIKYRNSTAPRIQLTWRRGRSEHVFAVKDNGIGIDPQYAERIFLIFQRLHTREEYAGSGVGLAVCKKIVERHGGRIWVESEPGRGATFYFTLPAAPSEANAAQEAT